MVEPQSQQKLSTITNFTKYTFTAQRKTLLTLQIFHQTRFWLVSDKTFALHHF